MHEEPRPAVARDAWPELAEGGQRGKGAPRRARSPAAILDGRPAGTGRPAGRTSPRRAQPAFPSSSAYSTLSYVTSPVSPEVVVVPASVDVPVPVPSVPSVVVVVVTGAS